MIHRSEWNGTAPSRRSVIRHNLAQNQVLKVQGQPGPALPRDTPLLHERMVKVTRYRFT